MAQQPPGAAAKAASSTGDAAPSLIGKQAGNFRLIRILGAGGMGAVYEAEHAVIGTRVAVKILSGPLAQDKTLVDRFFQEASAASHIKHQNIVQVLDVGGQDGFYYCVMELLEGQALQQLIGQGKPVPLEIAAPIVLQVCAGLRAAHAKGITHRDVKPANIMLMGAGPRYKVKIVDFGIARLAGSAIGQGVAQTQTGTVMGTPAYMSPEQAAGKVSDVDGRSDLYALGIVMYEMAAGRHPFPARTMGELLIAHIQQKPPRPSLLVPTIPQRYEAAIMRALEKDKRHRFANAEAMGHEVQEIWEELHGGGARSATPVHGSPPAAAPSHPAPQPAMAAQQQPLGAPAPPFARPGAPQPPAQRAPAAGSPPTALPREAATQMLAGAGLAGGGVLLPTPARGQTPTAPPAIARTAREEAARKKKVARWPFVAAGVVALGAGVYVTGAYQDPARAATQTWEAIHTVVAEATEPKRRPARAPPPSVVAAAPAPAPARPAAPPPPVDLAADLVTKGPYSLRSCWNALKNFRGVPLAKSAAEVQEALWSKTTLLKEFRRCTDYAGAVGAGSGEDTRAPPWMVLYLDGRATLEFARELKALEPKRFKEAQKLEGGDLVAAVKRAADNLSDALALGPDDEYKTQIEQDWGAARVMLREAKGE